MKRPSSKIISHDLNGERWVKLSSIMDWLKDELIIQATEEEEEMFAKEFLTDRLKVWESMKEKWEEDDGK